MLECSLVQCQPTDSLRAIVAISDLSMDMITHTRMLELLWPATSFCANLRAS